MRGPWYRCGKAVSLVVGLLFVGVVFGCFVGRPVCTYPQDDGTLGVGLTVGKRGEFSWSALRWAMLQDERSGFRVLEGCHAQPPIPWKELTLNEETRAHEASVETSYLDCFFEFNSAVASWNIDAPMGTCARIDVRFRAKGADKWSAWLYVGRVGIGELPGDRVTQTAAGVEAKVDVDCVVLKRPAREAQVRVWGRGRGIVKVWSLGVCVTDTRKPVCSAEMARESAGIYPSRLGVPFFSQRAQKPDIAGRICSPTSLAMVMNYYGVKVDVATVAAAAYDQEHDIFGNWPRSVQAAFELSKGELAGAVVRFGDWGSVQRVLDTGTPIIASIRVKDGELLGAPYSQTDGHLIVIEGMTEHGDLLVLDPAARDEEAGRVTYSREEMTKVWLGGSDGTGYVVFCSRGK